MVDKKTKQKLKRIWCERLVIGLFASAALGFFVAKIPTVYSQIQMLLPKQKQQVRPLKALEAIARDIKQGQALKAGQDTEALLQTEQNTEALLQALKAGQDLKLKLQQEQEQEPQHQFILLGISALCFILILLLLLRQRNRISLTLTGQLIIVLPEECITELEALHQQMKSEERSIWVIRTIMLWSVLELLWAFHIQINVENFWLPKSKGHTKIDE
ncbi:hypothetical protein H6G04_30200 [Calothrix membranacea FACHB-236]|nr:hypothetical protein [Calothrix membranacea FACHB-236]